MTVSATTTKTLFAANGAQTVFPYSFRVLESSDLKVYFTTNGTETEQTTGFTVSGIGQPSGGAVTFAVAPASGVTVGLARIMGMTQGVDLTDYAVFPAETLEGALDRAVMLCQQNAEQLDRAAKLPITSSADADALVADIVRIADSANNLDTVATNITSVNTVATNIAAIIASSTHATNAASSATAAASSATSAASSATTATTQATNAATSATNAASSATSAASSATTATTQATNAASSATAAASSATSAASSATTATTQATNAATSATSAATSATNAANSATAAATSETNAAASYDAFDDRYLGSKATAPTLDNDGNALLTGALYWNSTANQLYVWTGSAWNAAAFNTSGVVTSFSAGSTGLTPSTASTGAVALAGTLAVANGGTGVTTSTGSGSVVLSNSPSLTTPALGTPSSGTLTNCTFPTLNQNTTGTAGGISVSGGWAVTPSGTTLYFAYNGTNKAKLDSSGNLTCVGNVTAYGTV